MRRPSLSYLPHSQPLENTSSSLISPSVSIRKKKTHSLLIGTRPKPMQLRPLTRSDCKGAKSSKALMKGLDLMARLYGPVPREKEENKVEIAVASRVAPFLPSLPLSPTVTPQSPQPSTCKSSTLEALQDFEAGNRRLSRFSHNRSTSGTWNSSNASTGRLSLQPEKHKPMLSMSQYSISSPEGPFSSSSVHSPTRIFQFPPLPHHS
jgi:hypothetical protein